MSQSRITAFNCSWRCFWNRSSDKDFAVSTHYTPPLSLPLESFFLNLIKSPWIQFKAILACLTRRVQLILSVQKLAEDCCCFRVGVFFFSVFMIRHLLSHRLDFLIEIILSALLWSLVRWSTSLKHCAPNWVHFSSCDFRKLKKVEKIPVSYMTLLFMCPSLLLSY